MGLISWLKSKFSGGSKQRGGSSKPAATSYSNPRTYSNVPRITINNGGGRGTTSPVQSAYNAYRNIEEEKYRKQQEARDKVFSETAPKVYRSAVSAGTGALGKATAKSFSKEAKEEARKSLPKVESTPYNDFIGDTGKTQIEAIGRRALERNNPNSDLSVREMIWRSKEHPKKEAFARGFINGNLISETGGMSDSTKKLYNDYLTNRSASEKRWGTGGELVGTGLSIIATNGITNPIGEKALLNTAKLTKGGKAALEGAEGTKAGIKALAKQIAKGDAKKAARVEKFLLGVSENLGYDLTIGNARELANAAEKEGTLGEKASAYAKGQGMNIIAGIGAEGLIAGGRAIRSNRAARRAATEAVEEVLEAGAKKATAEQAVEAAVENADEAARALSPRELAEAQEQRLARTRLLDIQNPNRAVEAQAKDVPLLPAPKESVARETAESIPSASEVINPSERIKQIDDEIKRLDREWYAVGTRAQSGELNYYDAEEMGKEIQQQIASLEKEKKSVSKLIEPPTAKATPKEAPPAPKEVQPAPIEAAEGFAATNDDIPMGGFSATDDNIPVDIDMSPVTDARYQVNKAAIDNTPVNSRNIAQAGQAPTTASNAVQTAEERVRLASEYAQTKSSDELLNSLDPVHRNLNELSTDLRKALDDGDTEKVNQLVDQISKYERADQQSDEFMMSALRGEGKPPRKIKTPDQIGEGVNQPTKLGQSLEWQESRFGANAGLAEEGKMESKTGQSLYVNARSNEVRTTLENLQRSGRFDRMKKNILDDVETRAERLFSDPDALNTAIRDLYERVVGVKGNRVGEAREKMIDCLILQDYAGRHIVDGDEFAEAYKVASEYYTMFGSEWGETGAVMSAFSAQSPAMQRLTLERQLQRMFNDRGWGKRRGWQTYKDLMESEAAKPLRDALEHYEQVLADPHADMAVIQAKKNVWNEAKRLTPNSVLDTLTTFRYLAMLGNPKTHIRNIMGNVVFGGTRLFTDAVSGAVQNHYARQWADFARRYELPEITDDILAKLFNEQELDEVAKIANKFDLQKVVDERLKVLKGSEGVDDALDNFMNEWGQKADIGMAISEIESAHTPKKIGEIRERVEKNTGIKIPTRLEYKTKSALSLGEVADMFRKEGNSIYAAPADTVKKDIAALINSTEKYDREALSSIRGLEGASQFNSKLMNYEDQRFLEFNYRKQYMEYLKANGYSPDMPESIKQEMIAEARKHAQEEALVSTFRDWNELANTLNKWRRNATDPNAHVLKRAGGFASNAVMPFTNTPLNVMKQSFKFSPVGLLDSSIKLRRALKTGSEAEVNRAIENLCAGITGTGIFGLGVFLGSRGILQTDAGDDPLAKFNKELGIQNYSAKIGDATYTLDWLTPVGVPLFMGAELGKTGISGLITGNPFDDAATIMRITGRVVDPMMEMTMIKGINDTLEGASSDSEASALSNVITGVVESYMSSYNPTIMGQLSRTVAPNAYMAVNRAESEGGKSLGYFARNQLQKEAGLYDFVVNTVGKRGDAGYLEKVGLVPKPDIYGNVVDQKRSAKDYAASAFENFISPSYRQKITKDETDEAIEQVYKDLIESGVEPDKAKSVFETRNYRTTYSVGGTSEKYGIEPTKFDLTNTEVSLQNQAKTRSGKDIVASVLDRPIYNLSMTRDQKNRLIAQAPEDEKSALAFIQQTPQWQSASAEEKQDLLETAYGRRSTTKAEGVQKTVGKELYERRGLSESDFRYDNELTPAMKGHAKEYLESGAVDKETLMKFYDSVGVEKIQEDGDLSIHFYKKDLLNAVANLPYEEAEAVFNTLKYGNTKEYAEQKTGKSSSGKRGYSGRRRYGGGKRRRGSSTKAVKSPIKASDWKVTDKTYKSAVTSGSSSTLSATPKVRKTQSQITTKILPPTPKR